jgi:N-acetylglutamate synthase-like GNAT family acetyltransferase
MIRPAGDADAECVTTLVHRAYLPHMPRLTAGDVWVYEDDAGNVLGVVVLVATPTGMLLENVAVDPAAQHGGIGRALVAFAEAEAVRCGHNELLLYTNAKMLENLAFYRDLGFTITARKIEDDYDRIYMRKVM